ncbi:hypothetical protein CEUSTIGMA_g542.t1 [Chlamydomonas eustigma]|uniref:folate gamma-glutamyl hydrolase n=1 Tax=Chlamydomonas eustigma TaxID=1157962 RepID=A0A250WQW8_9CHLO|nr:hypothetical protein CEUSTIGMA_g542.t1 [Chlamydomonas eustigma]|eukprot:GAX73089.1 hypothetical protein CEUSTIGMA_g542.t1 [Chlamydomonas eustigma]
MSLSNLIITVLLTCSLSSVVSRSIQNIEPSTEVERWELQKDSKYKNVKPLIGIMTQPCHSCPGKSYIAAGFVKWIEAAGARAVPIRFYASDSELKRLFKSINGLIFPGGLTWLWRDAPYVIAARKLFKMAVTANDKGDVFPIWGTCLGFQLLHLLPSNISRNVVLIDTDSVSHASTLDWSPYASSSHMFGGIETTLYDKIQDPTYNLALENHMYGMPPYMYERYPVLSEWYNIISTTKDRNGTVYISSMEGKKYPFFGTQWHPEKPPYEFGIPEVPHTLDAIRVSQHTANVFVDVARHSGHTPESHEEELNMLIYGTAPVFSARDEVAEEDNYDGPDITYYFDPADNPPLGPDDGGHPDPDEPDEDDFRAFETYKEYKAAKKLRAAHRRQEYQRALNVKVLEL